MSLPQIDCLCLTRHRAWCLPSAVSAFRRSLYPIRRLLVLDNSDPAHRCEELINRLAGDDPRIEYHAAPPAPFGTLRQWIHELSHAPLCALWDDDDWHGPRRLTVQQSALSLRGAAWVALGPRLLWHELATGAVGVRDTSEPHDATVLYRREAWLAPAPAEAQGVIPLVVGTPERDRRRWAVDGIDGAEAHYVYRVHGAQSARLSLGRPPWRRTLTAREVEAGLRLELPEGAALAPLDAREHGIIAGGYAGAV